MRQRTTKNCSKNEKMIKLNKGDVAIKVSSSGEVEVFIPNEENVSSKALIVMLKEIRKLETVFTELHNEIFKGGICSSE